MYQAFVSAESESLHLAFCTRAITQAGDFSLVILSFIILVSNSVESGGKLHWLVENCGQC